MKKFYSILLMLAVTLFASATPTDIENENNLPYLKSTAVQIGSTADVTLCVKADNTIGTVIGFINMPEGVTIKSVKGVAATNFNELTNKLVLGGCEGSDEVATITVEVAADVQPGDYEMSFSDYQIVEDNGKVDYTGTTTTTLTIQKTAVIEEMPEGYALEVIPFVAKEGSSKIDILFKAPATSKGVTFDIELPQGMMFYDAENEFAPSVPVLNASACTKTPTVSLNILEDTYANKATVSVMGQNTGAAALRKYINKLDELTTLVSIPVYVVPSEDIEEWGEDYALNEGVYEAKLNNIVVTDYTTNDTYTGNYLASVFVGEPITDAILYGHYTAEGKVAAAAMNGGSADITAATIDGELVINDVLIMGKDKTAYERKVGANDYATICLPFAIAGDLYTVKEISETSITLAEAKSVAANTPAIIKGNIHFSINDYVAPEAPVAGENGLTGTYKYIEKITGYYLAGNKFYNDYADIKPFRAYIPAPASAKPLSILIETANGIIDITDQLSAEDIYSLQGIKMNKAQKGVNIVGGKKIYVK